ncbi:Putative phospholipid:diacylglycerol acyltransferase 2 [Dionaea muscipula]
MYMSNGYKKVVVVPHSMGVIYFLHFLKWVESPIGGGGGTGWCAKHIKAIMNIAPAFLGVPKTVSYMLSAEAKHVAFLRSVAPGVFDSEIVRLQNVMRMFRTWDSVVSLLPKGGETIWGNLDWSPEQNHQCKCNFQIRKKRKSSLSMANNSQAGKGCCCRLKEEETPKYGRIISFSLPAAELPSQLPNVTFEEFSHRIIPVEPETSCGEIWTEYDELRRETIREVAKNKAYTAKTVVSLFSHLAPKMMQRALAHFSHGIADDLDDPIYAHYKYWSNPLETKLPNAPDMEVYCLYGVGIPTERSYIYKLSSSEGCKSIPYRIDSSAEGSHTHTGWLKRGIYFVDGDESVPVISAGFMCAKGWRGKTRFNPSGMATYVREYRHKPPSSLLEGRGVESGAHVDILGNGRLINDVMRVAAGARGEELGGGDRIYSDIIQMSERIDLPL